MGFVVSACIVYTVKHPTVQSCIDKRLLFEGAALAVAVPFCPLSDGGFRRSIGHLPNISASLRSHLLLELSMPQVKRTTKTLSKHWATLSPRLVHCKAIR